MATQFFGIECQVYMVRVSYEQKPYRRSIMQVFGARVIPSPSSETNAGRGILEKDPESPGSLGIAISEAVEDAAMRDDTKYSLGSVLNHVLMHQTVIGQEARKQMEMADAYPDVVIGCVGGGSNFSGLAFPFLADKLSGQSPNMRVVAVEPAACPTLTKGVYAFDYGDTARMAPIVKMHTLGHTFVPRAIHAGGLRYHGMAPLVSHLVEGGFIEPVAYAQNPVFEAAIQFSRSEGIVPAPESAHAIKAAVDEALACKERGESRTILFNLSGHGYFDLTAYDRYLSGDLEDYEYPLDEVEAALANLPTVAS
jgi:tryptophan synthase beta chain